MSDVNPRDFGRLESQVTALSELVRSQSLAMCDLARANGETLALMKRQIDSLADALSEARGGWRVLMLLGGAGAALGTVITWAANHLRVT